MDLSGCPKEVDNIIAKIINEESFTDLVIMDLIKDITDHKYKENMIINIVSKIWVLEATVPEYFIHMFINLLQSMDHESNKRVFLEVKKLLGKEILVQKKLIDIIPALVSNIRRVEDEFTGYIAIKEINCHYDNFVPLIKVMREINTMSNTEKAAFIKRLLDSLRFIDLSLCPELVREILLLCDKANLQYCIGSIIHFFNSKTVSSSQLSQSTMNSDSKRMMEIQLSVLSYCYDIAKFDCEFVKELMKFAKNKNPVFSISGFMCIILLSLASLDYAKDQILDYLKLCITTCFKDNKLILESAFIRESVSDQFDMDSLLLNAVKYCCVSNRNQIATSLLHLGFLLIKSGLPKSKIVSLKKEVKNKDEFLIGEMSNNDFNMTTSQKVGHAGVQMLIHLFKKLTEYRQIILDNILSFILKESHRPSVFIYLELFADLISLMPLEMHSSIDKFNGQPIFEVLCHLPHDVALSVVHALLPLIRYSVEIRKPLVTIILTNLLSGQEHARMICVECALVLLKYLRITVLETESDMDVIDDSQCSDLTVLTQSSQFACTQIALESRPLHVDNSLNEAICKEILSMIDLCCHQYHDTKSIIYRGLVKVIERNFHFSGQVVLFLLTKLESVLNPVLDTSTNPFLFTKILTNNTSLDEPIGILVSCLAESVRRSRLIMPPTDILCTNIDQSFSITAVVERSETLLNNLLTCLSSQNLEEMNLYRSDDASPTSLLIAEQFVDIYEVLLVHFVSSSSSDDRVRKIFEHRESAQRIIKSGKRDHNDSVISLPTLAQCLRHLLDPLRCEIKSRLAQARSRPTQSTSLDQDSLTLFLNEKVSAYLLNRAVSLIKKIGCSECRVTSRNREEMCAVLAEFVNVSLDYYMGCLCIERVDSLTSAQRQLMQSCCVLFCVSVNKIIQFFSKTMDHFLGSVCSGVKEHVRTVQHKINAATDIDDTMSMSVFVTLTKSIITRILLLAHKRLYTDVDGLLNVTLNLAIFCGLEDIRHTVTYGSRTMNVSFLHSLYSWLYNLLTASAIRSLNQGTQTVHKIELQDPHLGRVIVSLCGIIARIVRPDSICFVNKLTTEITGRLGSYSMVTNDQFQSSFPLINNPGDIVSDLIGCIDISLDDTDWLLSKWKSGCIEIKQQKAISSSQLSNISSSPDRTLEKSLSVVHDQNVRLVEQLQTTCQTITNMIQCNINSVTRLQELVKITTRLFNQLTILTKQYSMLTKANLESFPSDFKKLVMLSGGNLSAQVSLFIVYIQKVESVSKNLVNKENVDCDISEALFEEEEKQDNKKKKDKNNLDNQISRTEKEIKLIPNLVYSMEQYQRYLIQLQRASKVDLMKYVRTVNSRDFRIDLTKLQESLDQNMTVDISDDDDDGGVHVANGDGDIIPALNENMGINEQPSSSTNDRLDPPPPKKQRTGATGSQVHAK